MRYTLLGELVLLLALTDIDYDASWLQWVALSRLVVSGSEYEYLKPHWGRAVSSIARSCDDELSAGAAWYSAGNSLLAAGQWREAFTALLRARRSDSVYGSRFYWLRDVGVSLFELGRYRLAAKCYAAALLAGGDPDLAPRLADCHFMSGDFMSAASWFVESPQEPEQAPYWMVKEEATRRAVAHLARFPSSSKPMDQAKNPQDLQPAERAAFFEGCVLSKRDDPLGWFNLAVAYQELDRPVEARDCWMISACLAPGDSEAWSLFILNSLLLGETEIWITMLGLWAALDVVKERLFPEMDRLMEGQPSELRDGVRESLRRILQARELDEEPPGTDRRFTWPDLGFEAGESGRTLRVSRSQP